MKKLIVFLLVAAVSMCTMSTLTGCGKKTKKDDKKDAKKDEKKDEKKDAK